MPQGPLRLLLLAAQYFPAVGGSETQLRLLARELKRRGHHVSVWTRRLEASHAASDTVDDVPVTRLGPVFRSRAPWILRLERLFFTARLYRELRRSVRSFDAIFANQLQYPAVAAALACRSGAVRVAARSATSGPKGEMHREEWSFQIQRWVLTRYLDRVVALGPGTRADCEAAGFEPARIVVIPNGIDLEDLNSAPRDQAAPMRVVWLGKLRDEKRPDLAIAAWRNAEIPGEFCLLGDGPGRGAVLALIASAEAASPIRMKGLVADARPDLRAAHVFLQSSDTEGLSNSLLEAMAEGCACVATDVGETRFALGGENSGEVPEGSFRSAAAGLLVRPGDVNGMSSALRALRDPARRESLGRAGQALCRANHSMAAVARKYEEFFEDLVRTPRGERVS
jgi:glycosyltransferase involved in cell wall biosynthesis